MLNENVLKILNLLKIESENSILLILGKIMENRKHTFARMLSKRALNIASSYLLEEKKILEDFMMSNPKTKKMNLCVIGAGPLYYLSSGLRYAHSYIGIEPYINLFVNSEYLEVLENDKNIKIISQSFENFCRKRNCDINIESNMICVFWFNVINYIKDPIKFINHILKKGDIVFVSGWNDSSHARNIMKKYFEFISGYWRRPIIPIAPTLQNVKTDKIYCFKKQDTIIGKITEIRIIYTQEA